MKIQTSRLCESRHSRPQTTQNNVGDLLALTLPPHSIKHQIHQRTQLKYFAKSMRLATGWQPRTAIYEAVTNASYEVQAGVSHWPSTAFMGRQPRKKHNRTHSFQ
jgi:hypothetical protein